MISLGVSKRGMASRIRRTEEELLQTLGAEVERWGKNGWEPPADPSPLAARVFSVVGRPFQLLRSLLSGFIRGIVDLSRSALDVDSKIESLATATTRQSDSLQQAAAAVQQLAASATQVAEAASRASEDALKADEEINGNIRAIEEALAGFAGLQQDMLAVKEEVLGLTRITQSIEEVAGFIAEVADQTRLLALNAKIEAARAGEAGRGFAVVADQVGNLSRRTQEGARRVRELVGEIAESLGNAARQAEQLARRAAAAQTAIERAPAELQAIQARLASITAHLETMAAATEEQAAASEEAAGSLQEAGHLAQSLAQGAQEAAANVGDLTAKVEALRRLTNEADLPLTGSDILVLAKADHLAWMHRLRNLFWGREGLRPADVASDRECRFGRWYHGPGKLLFGSYAAFDLLAGPHGRVHALAKEIVTAWGEGQKEKARSLFTELQQASEELLQLIGMLEEEVRRRTSR